MKLLFKNIHQLVQVREHHPSFIAGQDMKSLPIIDNAFLFVDRGKIVLFGKMSDLPDIKSDITIDATGRIVLPSWCDSHTHIVYAGNRTGEFVDRINGLSYEEIANRGGGILNSALKLEVTPEEELYQQSKVRLEEVIKMGTGAIEIKSGYGLSSEAEIKMLRVIKMLQEAYNIPIKATFLGAHAFPQQYKENKKGYIDLIVDNMIPKVAEQNLASFIDVFCEKGYFSVEDTERILQSGVAHGLIPKIHVNQFNSIGGVQVGVSFNALSVDHLEVMTDQDIESLMYTKTMPVALPGCSYFLSIPYAPARTMIDHGLPLALATDYNPGSAPSGNMNFVVATACIKMRMTPEEAINAATINGAYAMGLHDVVGSITKGKLANLLMTKPLPSYSSIPYNFGSIVIDKVYVKGKEWAW